MMREIIFAFLVAFFLCIVIGPIIIPLLRKMKFGQQVRDDGPEKHLSKQGTPTIGGLIFIIALIATIFLFSKGSMEFAIMAMLITLGYGLIGFLDDFIKVKQTRSLGLRAYQKIIGQFGLALVIAIWAKNNPFIGSELIIPWTDKTIDFGVLYIPFVMFCVIGFVNAVNLTDGLDGLASGVMLIDSTAYVVIFFILFVAQNNAGNNLYAANLNSMAIFSAASAGACLGFLRFNTYPARVFMGDTGSMAMGGMLCAMGIMSRSLLILPLLGIMYFVSALSVILQVGSYKLRNKKRVFLMAPLHHHYELKGYPETKIVSMYIIITIIACLLGVSAFL